VGAEHRDSGVTRKGPVCSPSTTVWEKKLFRREVGNLVKEKESQQGGNGIRGNPAALATRERGTLGMGAINTVLQAEGNAKTSRKLRVSKREKEDQVAKGTSKNRGGGGADD